MNHTTTTLPAQHDATATLTIPASTTLYVSAHDMVKLVRTQGIQQCMAQLASYLHHDYARWNSFDKSPRVANHSTDGVIELMPISDAQLYSFKYVNGHPKNTAQGLSSVMAFGVLADVPTGTPLLLSEMTLATALRTAAMSAIAAKALARPDSRVMALIGNGAQSEFQALAFQHLVGITEVRLFDIDPGATRKLMRNLKNSGLKLVACDSVAQAMRGADIVTTITADKANATIITPDLMAPGMHINGVGGDCPGKTELHPDVLRMAKVFVEYTPQTRIEGDIQQMPADFAVTELWQVFNGTAAGRQSTQEITVFDSVGFALEDFSTLRFVYDTARRLGLGEMLGLIPELDDPKDLFGCLGMGTGVMDELGLTREALELGARHARILPGEMASAI